MANLRQKLPVSYLLFTTRGRISRSTYWHASILIWCSFYILYYALNGAIGPWATWVVYPPFFWSAFVLSSKRLHDVGKSGWWLALFLLPVLGPIYLVWQLLFRRGTRKRNRYGYSLEAKIDYLKNDNGLPDEQTGGRKWIINDITQLNPVVVREIARPKTVEQLQGIVRTTSGPISVGGGRFSMGGQTVSRDSLHVDMRELNQVLDFSKEQKWIRVQAGIRWCDIQRYIDRHNLSVKVMQTYANFTVGGALSVNAHGRYMGLGPAILSVRWIRVVLPDGSLVQASKTQNSEIFFGAIGGYNGIGIIVEAELDLADNVPVKRVHKKIDRSEYLKLFKETVRGRNEPVFHNADIYPPDFERMRSVTWEQTGEKPTVKTRLMPLREWYPINRYFLWSFSETPFGKWRREYLIEPLLYFRRRVHWRNYEAGYDVAELEPQSRQDSTYVLLEYFVPIERFEEFARASAEVFIRHRVNVLNISVRHSVADPGSYLAWAREEVFAFVVYYKQLSTAVERNRVAVWTRELVDAVISLGGAYYLPYQPHATPEQFHRAYPNAKKLFDLKARLDPDFKLRNVIWDTYYKPPPQKPMNETSSEFKAVFSNPQWRDGFYRFLQVVFHLYPEDKFHHLIAEVSEAKSTDQEIYNEVQRRLKEIKPFLSELTYALPALKKQKREMTRETLELLGDKRIINGYVEIGSTGRYISNLRKHLQVGGEIFIINDVAPNNSVGEIFERGQLAALGRFIDLADYQPIAPAIIPDGSIDLVTIFIGFHHCPVDKLPGFIKSLHRILRPGGSLILRDHNVRSAEMATFVSLVHTVFNLGLNVPWEKNQSEFRSFKSIDDWSRLVCEIGFSDSGKRLFQDKDPSDNALVRLVKQ
ncbi:MAG: FAD-binding oxidoreductase [Verrucomicrobia bacterium]|nr:MAG: FAD-binding oxidoreductase [Verrucomicrobiota bacterium]